MPQPARSEVHVDSILTQLSIAYVQDQTSFIAGKVFPVITVGKQSDKYFTYTKNDWFRDEAERRADATESAGSGYNLGTDNYSCDLYAFHKDIGDRTRKNADSPLNLDADATRFVTGRMLLRQEIQWVSDYFTTGLWGTDKVGTTDFVKWSDYANSDPIEDIEAGKESILSTTGYEANSLVIGYKIWRKLKHHPDVRDRYKYVQAGNVTPAMVAALFEIDNLYVAKAIKATNKEGQTGAYAFTHGSNALLCHVAPNPGLLTPSAGYTFAWDGLDGGLKTPLAISTIRMDLKKADRVEGESAWDNKLVATDLGYFFSSAVA